MATRPLFLERTASGLRLGLVRSEADFARLADEWPRTTQPFRSHDWLHTWWRHFGRSPVRRELAVLMARDGAGALRGVLPLYREHGPFLRWARLVGAGVSRHLGVVAASADEPAAAAAFAQALEGALRARFIDGVTFDSVDGGAPLMGALPVRLARPESAPPRPRRPCLCAVELESLTTPQTVARNFGDFMRLAQPGWTPAMEAFHRDAALLCTGVELHFLSVRGRRRAALLGLAHAGRLTVCARSRSRVLLGHLPHADVAGGDACLRIVRGGNALRLFHAADRLYRLVKGAA